ncbi:flagellar motor switch protein FliG [Aurantiacibacter luteus]|uniref:Flagellar motor switch protein FliG n=1 Tax=Aurantiacibacter luteus TaxID=1581420 RepID=A0A0G9MPP0_9SPHN|nr:FliG C-terminal domain-containing protein [Aurantiacibacter luteus]KLE31263.1 hypothetical protein AAW00_13960 [Aurantiacibacter luteus]
MSALPQASDIERAAIVVMLMDEADASSVLAHLTPEELTLVGTTMCNLGTIAEERIADALAGFIRHAANEGIDAHDRPQTVRRLMQGAVGEVRGEHLMQRIAPPRAARSLEIARWLAPESLLALLDGEHPQAIAVLLLLLDPEPAAHVLAGLPQTMQPVVVERIARMGPVSAAAVAMLDDLLSTRIVEQFGRAALVMGGAREAAELINQAMGNVGAIVMPEIDRRDSSLARRIEAEMFTFAMLSDLEPQAMGRLLRDIESEVLVDALKGLAEEERQPFFAAMSSRAADGVKDEIELRGRIRKDDARKAQNVIVEAARKLADQGEIVIGSGDNDYV